MLEQAFIDFFYDSRANGRPRDRDEARRFLLRDKKLFTDICEMPGINPEVIRKTAKQMEDGILAMYVRP